MKENTLSYTTRIGKNNLYCQCKAIGKCKEALEYGVSRNMPTRDVRRFFSG